MSATLGRFEIKKTLGQGAMGEVYLGVDPTLGREVALKTILPAAAAGPESKARFAREAKAAGTLNHPNLVTIYEFGEDGDVLFIAMEYVKGHDLEELLRERTLRRSEALEVLAQVCDGLAYAHGHGIIHRDVKPSNVRVLREGQRLHAKVMDFGVARFGDSEITATGMVMGTVSYMAPEYIRTGEPDPRSDLFAVGVMLYEALSGRKPFSGDTTPTILYRIVNDPPDPLDLTQLKDISPAIRSVLDRALDKDPERRFPSADELAKALRAAKDPTWQGQALDGTVRLAAGPQPDATPTQVVAAAQPTLVECPVLPPPMPARRSSRAPLVASAAALLLLGIAAGGVFLWKGRKAAAPATATVSASTPTALPSSPEAAPASRSAAPVGALPERDSRPVEPATRPAHAGPAGTVPTQQPAPASSVAPALPDSDGLARMEAPERRNFGMGLLSEATRVEASDPNRALDLLRRSIAANPHDPRPYAWSAAILYRQERYGECRELLRQARTAGFGAGQLAACNDAFRRALDTDSFRHRLDGE